VAHILEEREVRALQDLARQIEERGLTAEGAQLRLILERAGHHQEVSAGLAGQILHASEQAVETWVRRGFLAGRVDELGHAFVNTDTLWRVVELDTAMPHAEPSTPDVSEAEILEEIAAYRAEQNARCGAGVAGTRAAAGC
jgi:hypothetical protein